MQIKAVPFLIVSVLFFILMFAFNNSAMAEWTVYKHAEIINEMNHTFRVYNKNSKIRGQLIFTPRIHDVFSQNFPVIQIDNKNIYELDNDNSVKTDKAKSKWVSWALADGKKGISIDFLTQIIKGKLITFQYYLPDGEIRETSFTLEQARIAIEQIVQLKK